LFPSVTILVLPTVTVLVRKTGDLIRSVAKIRTEFLIEMMAMKVIVQATLLLLFFQPTTSAKRARFAPHAVDRAVTVEMKRQKIVGAAIGVIRDGRVMYAQGYGFSNFRDRVPVRTTTVFNWASNSKPVVSVAALQLVESGHLDLDASIRTYMPDLPYSLQEITTRQLLCHQSGIPHYSNGKIVSTGESVPLMEQVDPEESIKRFLNSPLLFEPGSKAEYSSYAYILLTSIVQAAGKNKIDKQLSKRSTVP